MSLPVIAPTLAQTQQGEPLDLHHGLQIYSCRDWLLFQLSLLQQSEGCSMTCSSSCAWCSSSLQHVRPASVSTLPTDTVWLCRWRRCFSDQHLFASVLSYKGMENETACDSAITNSGSGDSQRPHDFEVTEVTYQR